LLRNLAGLLRLAIDLCFSNLCLLVFRNAIEHVFSQFLRVCRLVLLINNIWNSLFLQKFMLKDVSLSLWSSWKFIFRALYVDLCMKKIFEKMIFIAYFQTLRYSALVIIKDAVELRYKLVAVLAKPVND
jgi:hypothetical protein